MKNIRLLKLDEYSDSSNYEKIEDGIYRDIKDNENTNFRIALLFELEDGDSEQYPLEDILDKYYLYVSKFIDFENHQILKVELAGELTDIREVKSIIGKKIYNKAITENDGKTYINLIIE